jgi:hypothetical protein
MFMSVFFVDRKVLLCLCIFSSQAQGVRVELGTVDLRTYTVNVGENWPPHGGFELDRLVIAVMKLAATFLNRDRQL